MDDMLHTWETLSNIFFSVSNHNSEFNSLVNSLDLLLPAMGALHVCRWCQPYRTTGGTWWELRRTANRANPTSLEGGIFGFIVRWMGNV